MGHSPHQIILEAVKLAADANIKALSNLVARHGSNLSSSLVLRILLTYLPESVDPSLYTGFLESLVTGNLTSPDEQVALSTSIEELSEAEALRRVRKLNLLSLPDSQEFSTDTVHQLTSFLLERAHQIDEEAGALPLLPQLLEPFLGHSPDLRVWVVSTLLPLLRHDYDFYPNRAPSFSLRSFEALEGRAAVDALLSEALQQNDEKHGSNIGRDMRSLVGPWMYGYSKRKRRKLNTVRDDPTRTSTGASAQSSEKDTITSGWATVNDWFLELSHRSFAQAVRLIEHWGGPRDVDYGGWDDGIPGASAEELDESTRLFAQTALTSYYSTRDTSLSTLEGCNILLRRVSQILGIPYPPTLQAEVTEIPSRIDVSPTYLESLSFTCLSAEELRAKSNLLTAPNKDSIELASLCFLSARILHSLGYTQTPREILTLTLSADALFQKDFLRKTIYAFREEPVSNRNDGAWIKFRDKLIWLHNWGLEVKLGAGRHGVFNLIERVDLELDILRAYLNEDRYKLSTAIYCGQVIGPIPRDKVEKVVLEVAYSFYDNASNGNKSRGGVKKASEILSSFRSYFPKSRPFEQLNLLIMATHSLSFYSLTLQRGIPLKPVNIRINPDALSLIDKVLKQNQGSYTKLDDLLEIGRNLVRAGVLKPTVDNLYATSDSWRDDDIIVERRIIAKAIEAALAEGDFDTAYSYVVTRLSPDLIAHNAPERNERIEITDKDVIWEAAYKAGCCKTRSGSGPSEMRRLEQRMELLSQALLLAPPSSLAEVLATWRECEQEMNMMMQQDVEEEDDWNKHHDLTLPGAFGLGDLDRFAQKAREPTRNAMNEGAPMGLFDVARGAATAFSKSAFPLRAARSTGLNAKGIMDAPQRQPTSPTGSDGSARSGIIADSEGRVRKRDMVSNMVTGGLVSGIGWVLGAPSVRQD